MKFHKIWHNKLQVRCQITFIKQGWVESWVESENDYFGCMRKGVNTPKETKDKKNSFLVGTHLFTNTRLFFLSFAFRLLSFSVDIRP